MCVCIIVLRKEAVLNFFKRGVVCVYVLLFCIGLGWIGLDWIVCIAKERMNETEGRKCC